MKSPIIHILTAFIFLANSFCPVSLAQAELISGNEFRLPAPGVMVPLSPEFNPPILKGIKVHPDNPFKFEFILDKGDEGLSSPNALVGDLQQEQLKNEVSKLIKYFLASLTVPEKDLWVNLSPYEKDRIIPQSFGLTVMGRDLLAEDYMLKQITSSLIYPEDKIGRKFWKRIYEEAAKRYGTTNISVNTFNKVWIVPEKAVVYENVKAGTAYVVESRLKVMLEEDYLSLQKHGVIRNEFVIPKESVILSEAKDLNRISSLRDSSAAPQNDVNALGSKIIREIVLPELTKEINEGKNFAQLRQVYNSLILATWYKNKIKDSILERVYADKRKVAGIGYNSSVILSAEKDLNKLKDSSATPQNDVELIYQQYLRAFKKGVYNYIKEEVDPATKQVLPRKYFSGGCSMAMSTAIFTSIKILPHQADAALTTAKVVLKGINSAVIPQDKVLGNNSRLEKYGQFSQAMTINLNAEEEFGVMLIEAIKDGKKTGEMDNAFDWKLVKDKTKLLIRRWFAEKGSIDEGLFKQTLNLMKQGGIIEKAIVDHKFEGKWKVKEAVLDMGHDGILDRVQKARAGIIERSKIANAKEPASNEEEIAYILLMTALPGGKNVIDRVKSLKDLNLDKDLIEEYWMNGPGEIDESGYNEAKELIRQSGLTGNETDELEIRKRLKEIREIRRESVINSMKGSVSGKINEIMPQVVDAIKTKNGFTVEQGFWNDKENARQAIWWALDKIDGFKFRDARLRGDVPEMARLYRENVMNYKGGAVEYFIHEGGLKSLMFKDRTFLDRMGSAAALLRFALSGLVDEDAPGALRPWELGEKDVWDNQRLAKKAVIEELDKIEGFKKARQDYDIPEMANKIRKTILDYPGGSVAYFEEKTGLTGLMGRPRIFLYRKNSPAALFQFALPGLIDEHTLGALRPWEVEDKWISQRSAKEAVLEALDRIDNYKYREARLRGDVPTRAQLYRDNVIHYKGGQVAYFRMQAGTKGRISHRSLFLAPDSPLALLKFADPDVVDQSIQGALRIDEISKAMRTDVETQDPVDQWLPELINVPLNEDEEFMSRFLGQDFDGKKRLLLADREQRLRVMHLVHDQQLLAEFPPDSSSEYWQAMNGLAEKGYLKRLNDADSLKLLERIQLKFLERSKYAPDVPRTFFGLTLRNKERPSVFVREMKDLIPGYNLVQVMTVNNPSKDELGEQSDISEFFFVNGVFVGYGVSLVSSGPKYDFSSGLDSWQRAAMQYHIFKETSHPNYGQGKVVGLARRIFMERLKLLQKLTNRKYMKVFISNDQYPDDKARAFYLGIGFRAKVKKEGTQEPDYHHGLFLELPYRASSVKRQSKPSSAMKTTLTDFHETVHNVTGGIDLTAARMKVQVKAGDDKGMMAEGIQFHLDAAQLAELRSASGMTIGSIEILPMTNLREFLGAGDE